MTDAAFIDGFCRLADHGLMFELQTPWWHLGEAVEMAAEAPDVTIILNHAGLPSDRSADGLAAWRTAVRKFAELPQAVVKISGLGLSGGGWDPATNRVVIRNLIDMFGPGRCMFASNYPVDSLCADFATIWREFDEATADLTDADRAALFHGTAARVYDIRMEALG